MKEIRVIVTPEEDYVEFENFSGFLRMISSETGMAGVLCFQEGKKWTYFMLGGKILCVSTDIEPKSSFIHHKFIESTWEFVDKPVSEGQSLTIFVSRVKKPDWWKKQEVESVE